MAVDSRAGEPLPRSASEGPRPAGIPPFDGAGFILAVQALRAFVYGFGAVILGSTLASEGLSDTAVGAVFTAMLVGMALASFAMGRWADRIGRLRAYRLLLATMGVSGTVFALTSWPPLLLLAALTGTLSTDANESGPITSLEQGMLADAPAEARPALFGRYNAVAYLAGSIGALAAAGLAAVRQLNPHLASEQRWLLAFPVVAALCVTVSARIPTPSSDRRLDGEVRRGTLTVSRQKVRRLAGLFAVDAFSGGFIVQSFIVFWFHRRYGASTEVMGAVLFASGLLQAGSSLASGWLGPRFGLLNTMVFTHLPSNVLLAIIPLMPTLGWAVALLLLRYALSQMDVPARQAFIAAIVAPEERTAAAAYTNTARYLGRPAGPVVAGALMQVAGIAAPFVAAGGVKVIYDLVLYAAFRRVRPC